MNESRSATAVFCEADADAIAIALDHRDDYSVIVIFPYVLAHGNLTVGEPFAQMGKFLVFNGAARNGS